MVKGSQIIERESKRHDTVEMIREMFPEVKFPNPVLEPMYYGRLEKKMVANRKLVLDKETGTQFDIVSDDYYLIWHEEIVKSILDSCPEEFGKPNILIRILNDGGQCAVQANFPELGNYAVNGSKLHPAIKMINSINRTKQREFMFGAMELVCSNGLMSFRKKASQKCKHITGSIEKFNLEEEIRESLDNFSEQHQIWVDWSQHKIQELDIPMVMEALPFSDKEKSELLELPLMNHGNITVQSLLKQKTATLWAINSAATQFARHNIRSESRAEYIETSISEAIRKIHKSHLQ